MTDQTTRRVTVVQRPAVTTNTPPAEPAETAGEDHEEATRPNKLASGRKKE